jgi:hypothetical protein
MNDHNELTQKGFEIVATDKVEMKVKIIKAKIADNEKFFEATAAMKIYRTEYSFGGLETSNCDIH